MRYLQLKNTGFSRLRKKSSHIYIIIIIFFIWWTSSSYNSTKLYYGAHFTQCSSCTDVPDEQICPQSNRLSRCGKTFIWSIAFWFFGLGFRGKTVVFGNFKINRYPFYDILGGNQIVFMIRYRLVRSELDN